MPHIKPISDLQNYNEVLRDVAVGEPVFLTKNGKGCYALLDIADYEITKATTRLASQLAKGEDVGREKGWRTIEEVETLEELKLFYVKAALGQAQEDISAGRVEDADVFFDDLQAGKYD